MGFYMTTQKQHEIKKIQKKLFLYFIFWAKIHLWQKPNMNNIFKIINSPPSLFIFL